VLQKAFLGTFARYQRVVGSFLRPPRIAVEGIDDVGGKLEGQPKSLPGLDRDIRAQRMRREDKVGRVVADVRHSLDDELLEQDVDVFLPVPGEFHEQVSYTRGRGKSEREVP